MVGRKKSSAVNYNSMDVFAIWPVLFLAYLLVENWKHHLYQISTPTPLKTNSVNKIIKYNVPRLDEVGEVGDDHSWEDGLRPGVLVSLHTHNSNHVLIIKNILWVFDYPL